MSLDETVTDLKKLNHRKLWKPFMEKYDCQKICEVGVREGENFLQMIKHKPKVAIGVDSWIDDGVKSRNDLAFPQEVLDQQYESVKKMFADKPFVTIYREYSFEAVKRFPEEFFDLVYIDADHSYEGCLKDIADWYQKVKKNGFLIGDDYVLGGGTRTGVLFGVVEAVNNFAQKNFLTAYMLPRFGWAFIKR